MEARRGRCVSYGSDCAQRPEFERHAIGILAEGTGYGEGDLEAVWEGVLAEQTADGAGRVEAWEYFVRVTLECDWRDDDVSWTD